MTTPLITHAELREYLNYDQRSGIFTRKIGNNRAPAGTVSSTTSNGNGYARMGVRGRRYYVHRLAWLYMTGEWPADEIDHINRDRSDNRFDNLRAASKTQNMGNTPLSLRNTSGVRGVYWAARQKKWAAYITKNDKTCFLGTFGSVEAATRARRAAAVDYFGAFASEVTTQ